MKVPPKAQKELASIRTLLSRAAECTNPADWKEIVQRTTRRIDAVIDRLDNASAEIGRKGGLATAERGPEYFKRIAAMRKTRAGGRPKKQAATPQS